MYESNVFTENRSALSAASGRNSWFCLKSRAMKYHWKCQVIKNHWYRYWKCPICMPLKSYAVVSSKVRMRNIMKRSLQHESPISSSQQFVCLYYCLQDFTKKIKSWGIRWNPLASIGNPNREQGTVPTLRTCKSKQTMQTKDREKGEIKVKGKVSKSKYI